MATLDELLMAAATTIVESAGGEMPDGATLNEAMLLMAATIVTGGIGVSPEQIAEAVGDYLDEHPASAIPDGGTTGQLLKKTSDVDGAADWADPAVTAAQITDATAVGRNVLKAADAAAARSAIGAGTGSSNFDGAYASLTGKPTLFDGAYASLSGKPTLGSIAATDLIDEDDMATNSATRAPSQQSVKAFVLASIEQQYTVIDEGDDIPEGLPANQLVIIKPAA